MQHSTGKFYSWTIINESTVIKKGDKSFFEHNGSAIPMGVKWFFDIENMKYGTRKGIILRYQEENYSGRFEIDIHKRSRLFWHRELGEKFRSYYHKDMFPLIRFYKLNSTLYDVEFLDENLLEGEKEDPYTTIITAKEGKKKRFIHPSMRETLS